MPQGLSAVVDEGSTILDACISAGARINSGCGGRGTCGKCRVKVLSGEVGFPGAASVSEPDAASGIVLACQAKVGSGDLVVEVPRSARERKVYSSGPAGACPDPGPAVAGRHPFFAHGPVCTRKDLDLPGPTMCDPVTDLDRLVNALSALPGSPPRFRISLRALKPLSGTLRGSGWSVRAWVCGTGGEAEIVRVEGRDAPRAEFGIALDIGTTSVVACLFNLETRAPAAFARCLNSQSSRGADVITRIIHASTPAGLAELREMVMDDVNDLVGALASSAGINASAVSALMCAANTTMTQIALGVDPSHIRKEPYVSTANFFPPVRAADLGVGIHPDAPVRFMPCVCSYVGGDTTAGVVATGMHRSGEVSMLIDLGTNGEIVLGCSDWLACCSCSVGPAFEGSGVTSGMVAARGAVEDLAIGRDGVAVSTIGGDDPLGICGSGMIRAMAQLLDLGIVDRAAKFQPDCGHPNLRSGGDGLEFLVARGPSSDIVLTQPDLDNLLRSKAAVFSAARLLVRKMGMSFGDLSSIVVSGAFGSRLSFPDAVRIGLLPDLPESKFRFAGNTSLAGARAALVSPAALAEAEEAAAKMTCFELSGDNSYHEEYILACFLPHTDLGLFPSASRGTKKP